MLDHSHKSWKQGFVVDSSSIIYLDHERVYSSPINTTGYIVEINKSMQMGDLRKMLK